MNEPEPQDSVERKTHSTAIDRALKLLASCGWETWQAKLLMIHACLSRTVGQEIIRLPLFIVVDTSALSSCIREIMNQFYGLKYIYAEIPSRDKINNFLSPPEDKSRDSAILGLDLSAGNINNHHSLAQAITIGRIPCSYVAQSPEPQHIYGTVVAVITDILVAEFQPLGVVIFLGKPASPAPDNPACNITDHLAGLQSALDTISQKHKAETLNALPENRLVDDAKKHGYLALISAAKLLEAELPGTSFTDAVVKAWERERIAAERNFSKSRRKAMLCAHILAYISTEKPHFKDTFREDLMAQSIREKDSLFLDLNEQKLGQFLSPLDIGCTNPYGRIAVPTKDRRRHFCTVLRFSEDDQARLKEIAGGEFESSIKGSDVFRAEVTEWILATFQKRKAVRISEIASTAKRSFPLDEAFVHQILMQLVADKKVLQIDDCFFDFSNPAPAQEGI